MDALALHAELLHGIALGRLQQAGRHDGEDWVAVAEARALPGVFGAERSCQAATLGRMMAWLEPAERRVLGAWTGAWMLHGDEHDARCFRQGALSEGGWPGAGAWLRRELQKARVRQASPRRSQGMASSVLLYVARFAPALWGALLRVAATCGERGARLRERVALAALGEVTPRPAPCEPEREPGWTERVWVRWLVQLAPCVASAPSRLRQGLRGLLVSLRTAERQRRLGLRLDPFDGRSLGVS
jgi:hypothetical protein